jgi:leukotriene-A4 hydrolase
MTYTCVHPLLRASHYHLYLSVHAILCCIIISSSWYHKPGMPPVQNQFDQTLIKGSVALADTLLSGDEAAASIKSDALNGWDSAQIVILLERIITAQKETADKKAFGDRLAVIDKIFNFTESKNSEIRFRWLTVSGIKPLTYTD